MRATLKSEGVHYVFEFDFDTQQPGDNQHESTKSGSDDQLYWIAPISPIKSPVSANEIESDISDIPVIPKDSLVPLGVSASEPVPSTVPDTPPVSMHILPISIPGRARLSSCSRAVSAPPIINSVPTLPIGKPPEVQLQQRNSFAKMSRRFTNIT